MTSDISEGRAGATKPEGSVSVMLISHWTLTVVGSLKNTNPRRVTMFVNQFQFAVQEHNANGRPVSRPDQPQG